MSASAARPFNVVIVSPPDYPYAETFREVGETLLHGLRELGHDTALVTNTVAPDRTNILLGANLMDAAGAARLPADTIVYNFEQVHGDSSWMKPLYVDLVRRFETWDYSARNVAAWKRNVANVRIRHVPLGYMPGSTGIEPGPVQDIDVLFYGSFNDRRNRILGGLHDAGLNVVSVIGKFGEERDALIARAKMVLSVHFFDTRILEVPRIAWLLANRVCVVAEVDDDTEVDEALRDGFAAAPYDELVARCVALAGDAEARARIAQQGFERFSARRERDVLMQALQPMAGTQALPELPRRINVGSGKGWNLDWLNLDSDPAWLPDVVADLNDPLPPASPIDMGRFGVRSMPVDYFDEIHASHVLEHVPKILVAMESFLRLLRTGGLLVVEVPYDLSHGAWQDPTHVRTFNEQSWRYYTDWFWYLGWPEYRFEQEHLLYLLSYLGVKLQDEGMPFDEVVRTPRAVDAIRVRLRKVALTDADRTRLDRRWT